MELEQALAIVRGAGYRVNKPKERAASTRPEVNALGLPISPLYDPKYRMKYKTPIAPYAVSTAGRHDARREYIACMERKHAEQPHLLKEALERNQVRS